MLKIKLFLETGQTVDFVAEGIEIEKDRAGGLSKIKWGNTTEGENLRYVDLNRVVAITTQEVEEGDYVSSVGKKHTPEEEKILEKAFDSAFEEAI